MIAFGRLASMSANGMVDGTISENTRHSRTRRAISCAYCAPKSTTRTVSKPSGLLVTMRRAYRANPAEAARPAGQPSRSAHVHATAVVSGHRRRRDERLGTRSVVLVDEHVGVDGEDRRGPLRP